MRALSLTVLMVFGVLRMHSQTDEWKTKVGIGLGSTQYSGELANDIFALRTVNASSGILLSHQLYQGLGAMFRMQMGRWGYANDTRSFSVDMIQTAFMARYEPLHNVATRFQPFLYAGVALHHFSNWSLRDSTNAVISINNLGMRINEKAFAGFNSAVPLGLGLEFKAAGRVFISLDETLILQNRDNWDGIQRRAKDVMYCHTLSVSFGIASGKSQPSR